MVLTGLYRTYHWISDISAEKWKSGGTKNLKKMEKFSSRKLMTPFSLVVFSCCWPFPPAFLLLFCLAASLSSSFFFFLLLLLQFWPRLNLSSCSFRFCCVCVWLLFNCFVWVLTPHVNSLTCEINFKFQIYLKDF